MRYIRCVIERRVRSTRLGELSGASTSGGTFTARGLASFSSRDRFLDFPALKLVVGVNGGCDEMLSLFKFSSISCFSKSWIKKSIVEDGESMARGEMESVFPLARRSRYGDVRKVCAKEMVCVMIATHNSTMSKTRFGELEDTVFEDVIKGDDMMDRAIVEMRCRSSKETGYRDSISGRRASTRVVFCKPALSDSAVFPMSDSPTGVNEFCFAFHCFSPKCIMRIAVCIWENKNARSRVAYNSLFAPSPNCKVGNTGDCKEFLSSLLPIVLENMRENNPRRNCRT